MLKRLNNPFLKIAFDPNNAAIDWGVYGAPETFLIDASGIVREKHRGDHTPGVEGEIQPLLCGRPERLMSQSKPFLSHRHDNHRRGTARVEVHDFDGPGRRHATTS